MNNMPSGAMTAAATQPIQTGAVGTRPTAAMLMRSKKKKKAEPEKPAESQKPANASILRFGKR